MSRPIVVVDDHGIIAHLVGDSLERSGHVVDVVDPALVDDTGILARVRGHRDPIVLLELNLGDRSSLPLIRPLTDDGASVVLLTASEDEAIIGDAVTGGAVGVIRKSDPFHELLDAIAAVSAGEPLLSEARRDQLVESARRERLQRSEGHQLLADLTVAERAVLSALMRGSSVRDIALDRVVGVETVRSQVKAILRKLGARTQVQAIAIARAAGFEITNLGDEAHGT